MEATIYQTRPCANQRRLWKVLEGYKRLYFAMSLFSSLREAKERFPNCGPGTRGEGTRHSPVARCNSCCCWLAIAEKNAAFTLASVLVHSQTPLVIPLLSRLRTTLRRGRERGPKPPEFLPS